MDRCNSFIFALSLTHTLSPFAPRPADLFACWPRLGGLSHLFASNPAAFFKKFKIFIYLFFALTAAAACCATPRQKLRGALVWLGNAFSLCLSVCPLLSETAAAGDIDTWLCASAATRLLLLLLPLPPDNVDVYDFIYPPNYSPHPSPLIWSFHQSTHLHSSILIVHRDLSYPLPLVLLSPIHPFRQQGLAHQLARPGPLFLNICGIRLGATSLDERNDLLTTFSQVSAILPGTLPGSRHLRYTPHHDFYRAR